jgi:hypothetical protein
MSKTNDTSRDELTINDLNRELRDDELDAVTGGFGDIKGESGDKGHRDWVWM